MSPTHLAPHSHVLKINPVFFRQVRDGDKRFELRKADRPFRVGDVLHLREFDQSPCPYPDEGIVGLTGEHLSVRVTHIMRGGSYGLASDYVCMSISLERTP
jgi:hypothetical protein